MREEERTWVKCWAEVICTVLDILSTEVRRREK